MRTYKTPAGVFPSVTTILQILEKPGLTQWYAKHGMEGAKEKLDSSANRGVWVHEYAQMAYEDKPMSLDVVPEHIKGYCQSFDKFKSAFGLKKVAAELMVYSSLGYAGTLDFLGEDSYAMYLIDYKTSSAIYFSHLLQVGLYANALEERGINGGKPIIPAIIRLKADAGTPEIVQLKEWRNFFKTACRPVVDLWYENRSWRKKCLRVKLGNPGMKVKESSRKKTMMEEYFVSPAKDEQVALTPNGSKQP